MSDIPTLPLDRWTEWARRDDWHQLFVGSDIRQLIGRIRELEARNAELVEGLTQAAADFDEHASHAQTRIEDGEELGANVWRIALLDIKREALDDAARARALLTTEAP